MEFCDAEDNWEVTMKQHLINGLRTTSTIGDSALYVKHRENVIVRICGSYVDDSLNTVNKEFKLFQKLPSNGLSQKQECRNRSIFTVLKLKHYLPTTLKYLKGTTSRT